MKIKIHLQEYIWSYIFLAQTHQFESAVCYYLGHIV